MSRPDDNPDENCRTVTLRPSAAGLWPPLRRFIAAEARMGRSMARRPSTAALYEFIRFGLKQGWACLFGGIAIALMILTWRFYPASAPLARYDFLFLGMIAVQGGLLAGRLETMDEAKVILIYHLVGTAMEIFKTSVGSWIYPEPNVFRIMGVPLFSGFMYSCIGSYLCRAWRLFDFRFTSPSAPAEPDRAELRGLRQFLRRPLRRRLALAAVCRRRAAVRPHHHPLQGLAQLSPNAAAARLDTGVAVHLVFREHRHLYQNLALPVAATCLVDGLARQAGLLVPAADHQLHAGQPGQPAAGDGRATRRSAASRCAEIGCGMRGGEFACAAIRAGQGSCGLSWIRGQRYSPVPVPDLIPSCALGFAEGVAESEEALNYKSTEIFLLAAELVD